MAETSNFVIRYLADISNVKKQLRELETLNKKGAKSLSNDFGKAVNIISTKITSINQKKILGKGINKDVLKTFKTAETVFKGTDGKLKTLTETSVLAGKRFKVFNTTVKNTASTTRGFAANLGTLTKRALTTIPVWFALRGAMSGVFRTIKNGLSDIVTFDRALQKLRRNIEATSTTVDKDFNHAKEVIEEFSLKSGKSVQEVTRAVQRFATVGFDPETSLGGGLRSVQLAVTLFGEGEETAKAFAQSLRVFTEDVSSAEKQQLLIAESLSLTDQLWQTNAFDVDEFSANLKKFAGTAKIANLSLEDTLKLLATLSTGGLGQRAGQLLRTTVLKSISKFSEINRALDLNLDPNNSSTIEFISAMIGSLKKLGVTGDQVPVELAEKLRGLFNIRSVEPIAALVSLEKTLKQNFALIPDIEKFDKTFEKVLTTTGSLAEQLDTTSRSLGRVFVQGIVGGENFRESLQIIVDFLRESKGTVEDFGQSINLVGRAMVNGGIAFQIFKKLTSVTDVGSGIEKLLGLFIEVDTAVKDLSDSTTKFGEQIQNALIGDISLEQLQQTIDDIKNKLKIGSTDVNFNPQGLEHVLKLLDVRLSKEKQITEEKTKQSDVNKEIKLSQNEIKSVSELILKKELELLRSQGARTSQIIEAEQILRKQLGIEKTQLDQLSDQLRKEKEINDERRLRSELGNDSIKLFRIAQTEGIEVARRIGDVLSGSTDFSTFVRQGGKELDVFKKQFSGIFEQQQAGAFFRGDVVPGQAGLRGGQRIAIEEEAIRGTGSSIRGRGIVGQTLLENSLKSLKNLSFEKPVIEANSVVINTPGNIKALTELFQAGQPILGQNAQLLVSNAAQQERRIIDLNLNLDGKNFNFQGTSEAARTFAQTITNDPQVLLALENQIVKSLDNSESKISKGVDKRIDDF